MFAISLGFSQNDSELFHIVDVEHSNVSFQNNVEESLEFNYYQFMHIYMGAGVATGDFNNDGLPDIFFTSNMGSNKLYLNLGDFKFKDITDNAKVAGEGGFYTGVTTADVNNDGWLDIYVSCSGPEDRFFQKNLLFINNKDLTFTESSLNYGLSEYKNHSIQANFFDYDKDGDLDIYIVNTPVKFSLANQVTNVKDIYANAANKFYGGADKLFRNNGDLTFTDVSEEAGIKPDIFFGLNAIVADFNEDGWMDVFVSNDFAGPDFLYMNNKNGTFSEKAKEYFGHTTNYSMGADVGDINNDGHQDIFVLDMLPEDYKRSKTSMTMMPRDVMYDMVDSGYHWQYMHNALQVHNGTNGDNGPLFRDLGYFSGLENTDWSWSCLIADFNNDSFNDLHITNGIQRDVTNIDARKKDSEFFNTIKKNNSKASTELLKKSRSFYPSVKLNNYLFLNKGNFNFKDVSTKENIGNPSFSNGSSYADFDNDGDLDLVCNNVNDNAFIFRNISEKRKNNYLKIVCKGSVTNPFGYDTKVKIVTGNTVQKKELHTTRGYFSASEPIIHFGLGKTTVIDKIEVTWSDGKSQVLKSVRANKTLQLNYNDASLIKGTLEGEKTVFKIEDTILSKTVQCTDTPYDDFKDQLLLPHKLSSSGPCLAKGDFNNDGLEDFYVGGAAGFSGSLYLQQSSGKFILDVTLDFDKDKYCEDTAAMVFDANGDGYSDLYVASGSYEMDNNSEYLNDRLYINDGKGNFKKISNALPKLYNYATCVISLDYDSDGDLDIFIGNGAKKGKYPYSTPSYLLQNEGGVFSPVIGNKTEVLKNLGMVKSAIPTDFNNDGHVDIVTVGEWMPITFLENTNGTLKNVTETYGLKHTSGWWNIITESDLDNDGDLDYIVGNLGLNYKFRASKEKPFHVFGNDFDNTGTVDIVLAKDINSELFPVRGKMCSSEQMPFINDKFKTFTAFADANLSDIYGNTSLDDALHLQAYEFKSVILFKDKNGFTIKPLPAEVQYAVVNDIVCEDFDNDGYKDLLLAGNKYESEVETARGDAGIGVYLKGNKNGNFKSLPVKKSGFFAPGNVKSLLNIKVGEKSLIVVGENNAPLKTFIN